MKSILFSVCTTLVLAACGNADDAKDLLDRAIKAQGGLENTKKMQSISWKVDGIFTMGEMKFPYTAKYYFQTPQKIRFDMAMNFGGMKVEITALTNGKDAWESSGDMKRVMEEKKKAGFLATAYTMELGMLYPLLDQKYTLTTIPTIKNGDQELLGLNVACKGQKDVQLYFDSKTHLLMKTVSMAYDDTADDFLKQDVNFLKYTKAKDGSWQFEKIEIVRSGKPFVVETISDMKIEKKLDDSLFEMKIPK